MAGQNNCTEKPDSPHRTSGEGDFDLLALIARLVERPGPSSADPEDEPEDDPADDPADGLRMSPETIGRVLAALVEQSLPGGMVVTTRDDFERARERAYAQGWQDAVQHTAVHIPTQPTQPTQEPRPVDPINAGTVIAFPPRIPLVRAADTASSRELMPHRPRRPRKPPKQP